jgi:hypothetical protein
MHEVLQRCEARSQTPEQHPASVLQEPAGAQSAPHAPFVHGPKQQGVPPSHASPCLAQPPPAVAHAQPTSFTYWHVAPEQHGSGSGATVASGAAQRAPAGRHEPPHRRMPLGSGEHGALPQHWSRNWHTSPGCLQQSGLSGSQPVGQSLVTAQPKQRRIPFASGLHTALPLPPPS